jgi:hypothetical protein
VEQEARVEQEAGGRSGGACLVRTGGRRRNEGGRVATREQRLMAVVCPCLLLAGFRCKIWATTRAMALLALGLGPPLAMSPDNRFFSRTCPCDTCFIK